MNIPEIIIVWDTEYTSWESCAREGFDIKKRQYVEIIQIGAVKLNTQTLSIEDEFSCEVRPVINSKLSNHIMALTGITQEQVEQGLDFSEAVKAFTLFKGEHYCYCYGNDYAVLASNILLRKWQFSEAIINSLQVTYYRDARDLFLAHKVPTWNYTSGTIGEYFGLTSGNVHNALADAKSLAKAICALPSKKLFNPS